jgi:small subunit ribosomal protein S1
MVDTDSSLKSTTDAAEEPKAPLTLMEEFLNDPSLDYKSLKYGDVMDGVIMRLDRDEILVDIGSKSEGVVPSREFSSLTSDEKGALSIGETILVFVVQPENQEGQAVVSIDRARQEKSWRRLQELYEANEAIQAEVTNYNKGGLLVNLDGVRGFVPASQVSVAATMPASRPIWPSLLAPNLTSRSLRSIATGTG